MEFMLFFSYMQPRFCETFPKQIGILGVNTTEMLFEISLACSITQYYVAEMKDIRKCPLDTTGK